MAHQHVQDLFRRRAVAVEVGTFLVPGFVAERGMVQLEHPFGAGEVGGQAERAVQAGRGHARDPGQLLHAELAGLVDRQPGRPRATEAEEVAGETVDDDPEASGAEPSAGEAGSADGDGSDASEETPPAEKPAEEVPAEQAEEVVEEAEQA